MALVNAFDTGPCQVILSCFGFPDFGYDSYLDKGDSSGPIPGANFSGSSEMVQVNVTSDGQIQLFHVSGGNTSGYEVDCQPDETFSVGTIQNMLLPTLAPGPQSVTDGGGGDLTYSGVLGAVTPDPCSIEGASMFIGLFQGRFT